jgi:hypothetical protein
LKLQKTLLIKLVIGAGLFGVGYYLYKRYKNDAIDTTYPQRTIDGTDIDPLSTDIPKEKTTQELLREAESKEKLQAELKAKEKGAEEEYIQKIHQEFKTIENTEEEKTARTSAINLF